MFSILMGLFDKFKIYVIVAAVFVALSAASTVYYNYIQSKVASLNKEIANLTVSKQIQDETIKSLNDRIVQTQKENDELNKKFEEIEKNTSKLSKFFSNHDLDQMAKENPGLLENKVNKGTKKVFNDLETLTQPGSF